MIVPHVIEAMYEKQLPLTLVKYGLVGMLTESVNYIKPKYKKKAYAASLRDFNAGKIFNLYEVEIATGLKVFVGNNGFEYFQN